jgi:type I restriction enzyme, S subunit
MLVPVPPASEQGQIATHIGNTVEELRRGVAPAERDIALMREYRTRLVADVVTGQIDVRAAAAKLPEEPRAEDLELVEESTGDEGEPSEFEDLASSGTIG